MKLQSTTVTGCGSQNCLCAAPAPSSAVVKVNGVLVPDLRPERDPAAMAGRVLAELLRQDAVAAGLLPDSDVAGAALLDERIRDVIDTMVDQALGPLTPTEAECRAVYDADPGRFVEGHLLHVRHILFAEGPAVNVHALLVRAEQALLELSRPGAPDGLFAELAAQLSDCATGVAGGDLGWVGPDDCEPALANELFGQKHSRWGMGVHPRLIHSPRGFHIVEVVGRRKGRPRSFAQVRERVAREIHVQRRTDARRQYVRQRVAQARLEGIAPEDVWTLGTLRFWHHD